MFDTDHDQRSIPATARRRILARQTGSVPRSPDAAATLVMIVVTSGLVLAGPSLLASGRELITESLLNVQTVETSAVGVTERFFAAARLIRIAVGWLLAAAAVAWIGNVMQFGLLFAPQVIQPDFERLSPRRGLQRMCTGLRADNLLLHCGRLTLVFGITAWCLWSIWPRLGVQLLSAPETIGGVFTEAVIRLGSCLAAGVVFISVLMAVAERLRHEAGLRLTPPEAREERLLNETDPAVVQRRVEVRRQFGKETSSPATTRHD